MYYIGLVICADGEGWRIQCLRRKQDTPNAFLYPAQEDIATYCEDVILKVLQPPKVVRNVYHFSRDELGAFDGAWR